MKDDQIITLRLSKEEKDKVRDDATSCCMSLNQYIKYKVLETESDVSSKNGSKFLDQNFPLLTRILINGYFHVRLLGLKHLTKEELAQIAKESEKEFQKLGVEKEENGCID